MLIAVEIDQVAAFVAIVRGGGFTRAGSILHLSQPAVSRRVELLERELGAPLFERIRSGDATLGLRYGRDPHPEIFSVPIYDEPMVVMCAPRHRLARRRSVPARALAREPWVAFSPRSGAFYEPCPWSLQHRLAASGLTPAEIIPIDSLTAQKRMVEAGFGLALLPESSVDEELRAGTLRVMHIPAMRVTIPVVLIHRRR